MIFFFYCQITYSCEAHHSWPLIPVHQIREVSIELLHSLLRYPVTSRACITLAASLFLTSLESFMTQMNRHLRLHPFALSLSLKGSVRGIEALLSWHAPSSIQLQKKKMVTYHNQLEIIIRSKEKHLYYGCTSAIIFNFLDATKTESEIREDLIQMVRKMIGPIAAFHEAAAVPAIPRTRSGKTPRKSFSEIAKGKKIQVIKFFVKLYLHIQSFICWPKYTLIRVTY